MPVITKSIETDPVFGALQDALSESRRVRAGKLPFAAAAFVLSRLESAFNRDVLAVTPTLRAAEDLAGDLALFSKRGVLLLPPFEREEESAHLEHAALQGRLEALSTLFDQSRKEPVYAVASLEALLQPLPAPETLRKFSLSLAAGAVLDPEDFRRTLEERGFERTAMVELPGEYAVRGGIVDVFPFGSGEPVRVEFFSDRVESLRTFDTATQVSLAAKDEVRMRLLPPSEIRPGEGEGAFATRLIAPGAAVVLLGEDETRERVEELSRMRPNIPKHVFLSLVRGKVKRPTLMFSRLPVRGLNFKASLLERLGGTLQEVTAELIRLSERYERVHVFCPREAQKARLYELFEGAGIDAGKVVLDDGRLSGSFSIEAAGEAFIPNADLFNRYREKRVQRRFRGRAIESFLDLEEGDFVVHASHGIGRFHGMEVIEHRGRAREFLAIEFADKAVLYVPAVNIGLVQKYVGGGGRAPGLSKLGSSAWTLRKARVQSAVADLASELIEIQTARELAGAWRFGTDTPWQREFEASFPYRETPSQELAADEIKADMASAKSMDRLLCGDVGYGKTEIAMRAAFKCAEEGKQTAVLVPTTLLAEQHFRTFRERMAEYPFIVDVLSRFKSAREQRDTLEKLKAGLVDVIIGTHRLLSDDVFFKDMGLLVIDEEQRFGVMHKEKLKKFRSQVEVLTMTATPIPRTLHMALMGARDISNLESPPRDRLAVETRIERYSKKFIREAIMYEIERGGQVYFVHNRVQSIDAQAARLEALVPEASFAVVHGQMDEDLLEDRMLRFIEGGTDVLVTTTIIENGMDIPNVNTLFINDAQRFGLADLHQLRGRVGRYSRQAYAWLFIPPAQPVSEVARKRLAAIEELSELGAGFKIAMRDLEIRGAGNILGREQSGHITAVGYDMFVQLLNKSVRRARKEPVEEIPPIEIDLDLTVYLPETYVGSEKLKMAVYRRLAAARSIEDVAALEAEMRDRFGRMPAEAERFIRKTELAVLAGKRGVTYIGARAEQAVIRFLDLARIEGLFENADVRVTGPDEVMIKLPHGVEGDEDVFDYLLELFHQDALDSRGGVCYN